MELRKLGLPYDLAVRIVKESLQKHRNNERIKNTRRRTHIGHLPNKLITRINHDADLPFFRGLQRQLTDARNSRKSKALFLGLTALSKQSKKAQNNHNRVSRTLTSQQARKSQRKLITKKTRILKNTTSLVKNPGAFYKPFY